MDFYEYFERILWKKSTKDKIGERYEIFVYIPFEDLNNKEIRKNIFEENSIFEMNMKFSSFIFPNIGKYKLILRQNDIYNFLIYLEIINIFQLFYMLIILIKKII